MFIVDKEAKPHFKFLEVKDVLKITESADSETITSIITEELKAFCSKFLWFWVW